MWKNLWTNFCNLFIAPEAEARQNTIRLLKKGRELLLRKVDAANNAKIKLLVVEKKLQTRLTEVEANIQSATIDVRKELFQKHKEELNTKLTETQADLHQAVTQIDTLNQRGQALDDQIQSETILADIAVQRQSAKKLLEESMS